MRHFATFRYILRSITHTSERFAVFRGSLSGPEATRRLLPAIVTQNQPRQTAEHPFGIPNPRRKNPKWQNTSKLPSGFVIWWLIQYYRTGAPNENKNRSRVKNQSQSCSGTREDRPFYCAARKMERRQVRLRR